MHYLPFGLLAIVGLVLAMGSWFTVGEAKALAISASSVLVDYERALRWNGQMPTTMMGADQNVLWSLKK